MRAKFKLVEKVQLEGNFGRVKFTPVTSGSPENESFFKWTPFGSIEIGTINEAVMAKLEVGKQYYVDFTEAT